MTTTLRWWALGLAAAACGCGKGEPPRVAVAPAEGKVVYKGKPAAGAVVTLLPAGNESADALKPRGTADKDGVFKLTTYPGADGKPDGAPAGEYLVSIRWTARPKGGAEDDDAPPGAGGSPGGDRLKEKYSNPKTSGLKVKIDSAGKLDPAVLDLK